MNKLLPFPKRLYGHLKTVHQHRSEVRKNCFACGLYFQGLTHDLSKYSFAELIPSIKYFQGNRSPYMYEKELYGYSLGWLHHKGRNKHHYEYWYDTIKGIWQPVPMPYQYLIESVCDRVAACKIYNKEKYKQEDSLNYYLLRNDGKNMHPETAKQMQLILQSIAEHGEEYTFHKIKESIKNQANQFTID